jgi:hypothetical protein
MSEAVMAMVSGPGGAPDDNTGMELKPAISLPFRGIFGAVHADCAMLELGYPTMRRSVSVEHDLGDKLR